MAYTLRLHPENVLPYFRDHFSLAREDRLKVFAALHDDLALHADDYMASEDRRLSPGSPYFTYDIVLLDSTKRVRQFWFAVSDEAAQYGVLLVDYVEETTRTRPGE